METSPPEVVAAATHNRSTPQVSHEGGVATSLERKAGDAAVAASLIEAEGFNSFERARGGFTFPREPPAVAHLAPKFASLAPRVATPQNNKP
jgi:hypothetical protein